MPPTNQGKKQNRAIDEAGRQAYAKLGKSFKLVPSKKIASWKALGLIAFFGGFFAATSWFISYQMDHDALVIRTSDRSLAKSGEDSSLKRGEMVGRAGDHILVKFAKGVSSEKRQAILTKHQLKEDKEIKQIGVKIVKLAPGLNVEEVVSKLLKEDQDSFEFVEVDAIFTPAYVPNDPSFSSEWHLPKIGAPTAWDVTKGEGATIAILDSGVDCNHPDLSGNCVSGWNVVSNSSDTSPANPHGTYVAGTAASVGENALGGVGVAYRSKIMPVRISNASDGSTSCSDIANGVIYAADHGAKVASNSYFVIGCSTVTSAGDYMASKGGVYVRASGNDGALRNEPLLPNVLQVGATDQNDVKTSWSNYGPLVSVVAPGTPIYCTLPGGGYGNCSGTSFSVPIVSGTLALIFAAKPGLTSDQAKSILFSTAKDLGTPGRDDYYGYGRVDAAAAVAAVGSIQTDTTPPSAPSNLTGNATASTVALSWTASTDNVGIAQYRVFRNTSQVGTVSGTSYTDQNVTAGTSYTYTVKAVDLSGNLSDASNAVSVTIPVPVTPFAISNLTARATSSTTATISWTTAKPSTGNVRYGTSTSNLNLTSSDNVSATSHTINLTGLTKKTRYYYQVTANSQDGQTATSVVQNFMTKPK